MYKRLQKWNVKIYFTDKFGIYRDFIHPDKLVQTKSETHLIECNNFPHLEEKLVVFLALFT